MADLWKRAFQVRIALLTLGTAAAAAHAIVTSDKDPWFFVLWNLILVFFATLHGIFLRLPASEGLVERWYRAGLRGMTWIVIPLLPLFAAVAVMPMDGLVAEALQWTVSALAGAHGVLAVMADRSGRSAANTPPQM